MRTWYEDPAPEEDGEKLGKKVGQDTVREVRALVVIQLVGLHQKVHFEHLGKEEEEEKNNK